jgi:hypothetical protein
MIFAIFFPKRNHSTSPMTNAVELMQGEAYFAPKTEKG